MEGRASVLGVIGSMLGAKGCEVELRLGRLVDGAYESGVSHADFERVISRLDKGAGLVSSPHHFAHEVHHDTGLIRDLGTGEYSRKVRTKHALFELVGTPFAVRVCQSTEERMSPPKPRPRGKPAHVETCVRAKLRQSYVYKSKARYDCARCVTSTIAAGTLSAARCTYEVEIEAVGDVTPESLLLKIEDVAGFLSSGHRGYAPHAC
jgi:hypothetical protein